MSRRIGLRSRSGAKLCLALAATGSLALSLLFGWTAHVAAQGAMALPGKFEVTPTGGADYTIQIAVPPGTAGMVPSVALSYNSQGRNGLVGMGWHLEGLPSIGRCPRTLAQDGVRGSINYDANDRFCLDGQRLVAISGTYGADGTEYRTEIESFSKIVSRGSAGTGPAWFEVWTKSGQRMEFGNTADSRVLAQGKPTARDWVVNKVSDTKGNYFTVTYINDTANGQVYPDRIDYTGNAGAGLVPYNSVRFVYDSARPDVVPAYHLGSLMRTTVRLSKVQTFAGSTMAADYRLAYDLSPTTGRSRLTSVTLCGGAGTCVPATTFGWQSGTVTPTVITNPSGQNGTLSGYRPYVADFNADGLPDIMWDQGLIGTGAQSKGKRVLWTGSNGGNFTVTGNFAGQDGALNGYVPVVADFNRDGRADVLWHNPSSGATTDWVSTGTGAFTITAPGFGPWVESCDPEGGCSYGIYSPAPIDLNGDGRADVAWTLGAKLQVWWGQLSWGVSWWERDGCESFPGWSACSWQMSPQTMDYNGDGVADIFWLATDSSGGRDWALWQRKGDTHFTDSTFTEVNKGAPSNINNHASYIVDINGDGKSDIVWDNIDSAGRSKGQRLMWLGKGDGTFIEQTNLGGQDGTLAGYRPYASDLNGDGIPDILWVQSDTSGRSSGAQVLWAGKGDGTFTVISNFGGLDGTVIGFVPVIADFNGDGKADILWDSRQSAKGDTRSTGTRVLWLSDGMAPDLMASVTTGIGAKVTVSYKSMTDGAVYTKHSDAVDPVIDLQGPMPLVSKVDATNAIGGTVSTGYAFAGAKAHQDGRGFLGFRQMTVTDLQTGVVGSTSYRQDFPFVALVESETKKLGSVTLNATAHTYAATFLGGEIGGKRYRVSLTQSVASSADLDDSALPTVTSTYKYDAFGNATEIVVSSSDGFSKTTTNTYTNDTTKWLLGRLTRATVKSTKP